ncbi:malonate decarboxylase holo-[acyl-carrier-protein] synthase [Bradyrhizobium sp. BRP22]|uniref:malonate decarboxylase holo-[acyl-carrier-protein] synthase n=1 Tax=Bradyrhizobium sp. BRP22 TaxID=2793821 RepID=UPI001CD652AD|nr:malonate decarboxylase holo-[acyl-carrier-protein] synthase [Bradyrhizobium sp. BRP22]
MRRHDLIFVRPESWSAALAVRGDLAADPLVAPWVENGWPLIGRRATPCERHGVALGLPLPPFAGKRRLSFLMQAADVLLIAPPPSLEAASRTAPPAWRATLERLDDLASVHSVEARVFGSLAWRVLTGLDYLTDRSDLDLLLRIDCATDVAGLVAGLAEIEALAPMRIDGELVRDDGAAVNWRELHAGAEQVLVKTIGGVALRDTSLFLAGEMPS